MSVTDLQAAYVHWRNTVTLLRALHQFPGGSKIDPRVPVDRLAPGAEMFHEHCLHAGERPFPMTRIIGEERHAHDILQQTSAFPLFFYEWCRSSRRVFRISDGIKEMFDNTDTSTLFLSEVPIPLRSFVIELETPLVWNGNTVRTAIVMFPDEHIDARSNIAPETVHVHLLVEEVIKAQLDKKQLKRGLRQKKRAKVFTVSRGFRGVTPDPKMLTWMSTGWRMPAGWTEQPFTYYCEKNEQRYGERVKLGNEMLRLAFQLCVYLASMKPGERSAALPQRHYKIPFVDRRAATTVAELFEVHSEHLVHRENTSGDVIVREGSQKRAHWRRGYYRRRSGEGNNPEAKKCIWVRPTLVNAHRLARGSVPGASGTIV